MAEETIYTAETGMVTISTANARLDGGGTLGSVITGATTGTIIKSVSIKAQANTTEGMIRLFIFSGANNYLLAEIPVPSVTKSSRDKSFETHFELDLFLQEGDVLKASTEKGEPFNIIAIGLNVSYGTYPRMDTTIFTAQNGYTTISVANPNLDGTGTLVQILQSFSGSFLGAEIQRIFLKAISTTSSGMLRLFIRNSAGTSTLLFTEIPVSAVTPTATAPSFEEVLVYQNFFLQAGYKIMASTENAQTFVVSVEALNFASAS